MLESHAKGKTTDALKSLMRLAPKTATVVRDGQEVTVSIAEVRQGDLFVVRPGENIPVDGIVIEGSSAVNEAALTGESIPVDKQKGSSVSAATTNQSGFLRCEATRVGEDTTLSQIIKMVSDAAATKAPIAKSPIKYPVCLYRRSSSLQGSPSSSGCLPEKTSGLHWRVEFPCSSSAVRVRWDLQPL